MAQAPTWSIPVGPAWDAESLDEEIRTHDSQLEMYAGVPLPTTDGWFAEVEEELARQHSQRQEDEDLFRADDYVPRPIDDCSGTAPWFDLRSPEYRVASPLPQLLTGGLLPPFSESQTPVLYTATSTGVATLLPVRVYG